MGPGDDDRSGASDDDEDRPTIAIREKLEQMRKQREELAAANDRRRTAVARASRAMSSLRRAVDGPPKGEKTDAPDAETPPPKPSK